jgi:hypothetical protein
METTQQNPLLAKLKIPGRTFQLPSRGALYHNGELSSYEGEVHVHPMSALTEINLKNPDLLFNGKAIEAVVAECIPEIKKPMDLFGRDIDALMFFLRVVTYGPDFEINVKHTCDEAKDHSYSINIEQMAMNMKPLDVTMTDYFVVTLPNGQVVKLRPVTISHMIKLFQMNTGKKELTADDVQANIVFNLVSLIENIDGETDKNNIEGWIRAATTVQLGRLTKAIESMNDWGPDTDTKIVCRDCGTEFTVELPLNPVSFFTE